jgi:hypothetical protein
MQLHKRLPKLKQRILHTSEEDRAQATKLIRNCPIQ